MDQKSWLDPRATFNRMIISQSLSAFKCNTVTDWPHVIWLEVGLANTFSTYLYTYFGHGVPQLLTLSSGLQANSMSWWITFGLDNLNCPRANETFSDQIADVFHGPLLTSFVGGLNRTMMSMANITNQTEQPTSLTGAMKFWLAPGVGT